MAKFNVEARLVIDIDAEDEQKAQKLAFELMDRRIDAQQWGFRGGERAHIVDWKLDTDYQSQDDDQGDDDNRRGQGQNRGGGGQQSGGSKRGFAAMDPETRSEIARKGGEASHGGRGGNDNRSGNDGGNRGGGGDKQLQAMEQFLEKHDLPPKGKQEVEEAIEKRRSEVEGQGART